MAPVVDKDTLIAYCTECSKPLELISIFMRRQMAASGQIRKNEKKKLAWARICQSCSKEGPPVLNADGETLECSFCNEEMTDISKPFAQMIKVNLKAQRRADG